MFCSGTSDREPDCFSRRWLDYATVPGDPARAWRDVVHPDDRVELDTALAAAMHGGASADLEVRLRRHGAEHRWHRLRVMAATGDPGTRRWFVIADDLDDARSSTDDHARRRARERAALADAQHASRLKDRFLATVSHELRTPIAAMLLWERVLRDDPDPGLRARALDAIHQSATTQERLVADLLDVSRAISGKLHVELRPLEIARLIDEALVALAPSIAHKRHQLVLRIDPDLGAVLADANRLRQVLDNLLSNAVKFTEPGGTISIAARRTFEVIVIEVSDTGCGIALEFLARAFEPFSQADETMTRGETGLGLGLAISYELVNAQGGTLAVSSRGPGHGATFTITLPAIVRTADTDRVTARSLPRLDGVQLLLVDDDPRVLEALQVLLQRAGAAVDTAESASAARGAMERAMPDVVLADIAMPGEDGYSFVRRLRQGAASTIPAVAITAHVNAGDRALAAGFDLFITKPVNVDQLISKIARLVETGRSP
jgi:hypothetical protein